jgi:hypothetical protein
MFVKNTGKKTIGFGSYVLTPDAVGELPVGYGPEHPTVAFYLSKGWLTSVELVDGVASQVPQPSPDPLTPSDQLELTEEEKAEALALVNKVRIAAFGNPEDVTAKIKSLDRMNLDPLRYEAAALSVEWSELDTKAVLIKKITEKLQGEKPQTETG